MSSRRPLAFAAPISSVVLAVLAAIGALISCSTSPSSARASLLLEHLDGSAATPLLDSAQPAVCLLLVRIDCPISNRYAPELQRLAAVFEDTADCWLVYCDPDQTAAAIEAHRTAYAYPFPALRDPGQRVAALSGAQVTPEVVVFGPARELIYAGRIDNRHVEFGKTRPAPTVRELEHVLEALAAGTVPEFRRVEAVGCPLPEPAP